MNCSNHNITQNIVEKKGKSPNERAKFIYIYMGVFFDGNARLYFFWGGRGGGEGEG